MAPATSARQLASLVQPSDCLLALERGHLLHVGAGQHVEALVVGEDHGAEAGDVLHGGGVEAGGGDVHHEDLHLRGRRVGCGGRRAAGAAARVQAPVPARARA